MEGVEGGLEEREGGGGEEGGGLERSKWCAGNWRALVVMEEKGKQR